MFLYYDKISASYTKNTLKFQTDVNKQVNILPYPQSTD